MSFLGRSLFFPFSLSIRRCTLFMSLRYVVASSRVDTAYRVGIVGTMDFFGIFNWHVSQVVSLPKPFLFCNSEQWRAMLLDRRPDFFQSKRDSDLAISLSLSLSLSLSAGVRQETWETRSMVNSGEMSVGLPEKCRERISSISEGAETRK